MSKPSSLSKSKQIKVFISSTFQDMQPERKILLSKTLPEIRRRTERLGFSVAEIDLRWGITEDQIASGRLVSSCLKQIDEARPFFVAIIGNRYGTVINEFADDDLMTWPFLGEQLTRSLTEIEIIYGALLEYNENALFYFKSQQSSSDKRIERLKGNISARGYFPRLFNDEQHLDHLLHSDLWQKLATHCGKSRPAESDIIFRSIAWHDAIVDGRRPVLEQINRIYHALSCSVASGAKAVVLLSDDDVDRSATLASLCVHPNFAAEFPNLITYFASTTIFHANPHSLLRQLQVKLLRHFGHQYIPSREAMGNLQLSFTPLKSTVASHKDQTFNVPETRNAGFYSFDGVGKTAAIFQEIIASLADQSATIVIDGLDVFGRGENTFEFIVPPSGLAPGVKLILGLRRGVASEVAVRQGYKIIECDRFDKKSVLEFSERYLASFGKSVEHNLLTIISDCPRAREGFFLRLLLQQLRFAESTSAMKEMAHKLLDAEGITGLIGILLAEARQRLSSQEVAVFDGMLRLLAVSRSGITHQLFFSATASTAIISSVTTVMEVIRSALGEHLIESVSSSYMEWSGEGFRNGIIYHCATAEFRNALRSLVLADSDEERELHAKIAPAYIGKTDPESRASLAFHLRGAEKWSRLARLLTETSIISVTWPFDAENIVNYCRDLAREAKIDVAREFEAYYLGKPVGSQIPESVIDFLSTMGRTEGAKKIEARHQVEKRGALKSFSWAPMAIADSLIEGRDGIDLGMLGDEVTHSKRTRNSFAVATAKARLARFKSRLGMNKEALDDLRECEDLLGRVTPSELIPCGASQDTLDGELMLCRQWIADCLMLGDLAGEITRTT